MNMGVLNPDLAFNDLWITGGLILLTLEQNIDRMTESINRAIDFGIPQKEE